MEATSSAFGLRSDRAAVAADFSLRGAGPGARWLVHSPFPLTKPGRFDIFRLNETSNLSDRDRVECPVYEKQQDGIAPGELRLGLQLLVRLTDAEPTQKSALLFCFWPI